MSWGAGFCALDPQFAARDQRRRELMWNGFVKGGDRWFGDAPGRRAGAWLLIEQAGGHGVKTERPERSEDERS